MIQTGRLYIVSTGTGEPDNITLKAYKLIQQADLVIAMPSHAQAFSELLQGKRLLDAGHGLFTPLALRRITEAQAQEQAKKMQESVRLAYSQGQTIVVLELGDPTLFGPHRGYLSAFSDLNPVVVPGVSSFNAANALMGKVLLEARKQRVLLSGIEGLDHASEAFLPDIWVFFSMGLEIQAFSQRLAQHYALETPVTIAVEAGFEQERLIKTTVGNLPDAVKDHVLPRASLIYVGI